MDMTVAIDVRDETSAFDVVKADIPEVTTLGRWRTLAVIAFSALAGGILYGLMDTDTESGPGSAAGATEQLLRRPEEPSAIALAIVIVLIVAVVGAAAAVALRRHSDL